MADVKWIKVTTDVFDDEKILMIESLPSADSIIVIWFKLLAFAGKQNNNGVFMMSNRVAYTEEMLASIFRRDVNLVRLALSVFEQYGMIEIIENVITIPNWNKHQTLDAYEKKKERDRLYQKERRASQRALIEESSYKSSDSKATQSSYVAISDKEEDKDIDKDNKYIISEIVSYLNTVCGTNYRANTKSTVKHINARLSEGYSVDDFKTVIDKKAKDWMGNDMEQYLRPETLFGTKFENYLNQKITKGGKTDASNRTDAKGYDASDYYGDMQSDFNGF